MKSGPRGAGVYYGAGASEATPCMAHEHVIVVGGGNSAGQAVMHFSKYAANVSMVVKRARVGGHDVAISVRDRIDSSPNIRVLPNTEVTAIDGDEMLQWAEITNRKTGEKRGSRHGVCSSASAASRIRSGRGAARNGAR